MNIGRLDQQAVIERKVKTRDARTNEERVTWSPWVTVWASVEDVLMSQAERMAMGLQLLDRPAKVRMRYFDGMNTDTRIKLPMQDDRVLYVVSIAQMGRREGWECMAKQMSTVGDAA